MIDLKYHRRGEVLSSNKSADEVIDRGLKGRNSYTLPNSDRFWSLQIILLIGCCSHTKNLVPVRAAHQTPLSQKINVGLHIRGSMHHSIIYKENPTRCNNVSKFLFHIYIKLNMFRATHRPSSGA
jgi:hypothetical protein